MLYSIPNINFRMIHSDKVQTIVADKIVKSSISPDKTFTNLGRLNICSGTRIFTELRAIVIMRNLEIRILIDANMPINISNGMKENLTKVLNKYASSIQWN